MRTWSIIKHKSDKHAIMPASMGEAETSEPAHKFSSFLSRHIASRALVLVLRRQELKKMGESSMNSRIGLGSPEVQSQTEPT